MSERNNTSVASALRQRRDWLLSACAAFTLGFSWSFAAALDTYDDARHAPQRHANSEFEAAFMAANQVRESECKAEPCLKRLAEDTALHAHL